MNILLVEDDKAIAEGLIYSLETEGYSIIYADCAKDAFDYFENASFDMAILDVTLPDGSGYEICKKIKSEKDIPIIFLTACDDEVNIVMGLDMGADDYITKPFRLRELLSRIHSVQRRYQKCILQQASEEAIASSDAIVSIGNLVVDKALAKVYKYDMELLLTALEYKLLLVFIYHQGIVLSRNQLLEQIWDVSGDFVNDNTLTVYIKRLREKIEDNPQNPQILKTIRGIGYCFEVANKH